MRLIAGLVAAALVAGAGSSAVITNKSMPDIARQYYQRMDCHNSYDLMVERATSGIKTATSDEIAFVKGYEDAAAAGTPCPAPPDGLAKAAANRIVSSGEALSRIGKFVAKDDPAALFEGGLAIVNDKVPGTDKTLGFQMIRKASDLGYAPAQTMVGLLFVGGSVTGKADYAAGFPFIEKAAAQGHVDALFLTGSFYSAGLAGKKDSKLAFDYFAKAAEQGHVYAAYLAFYMIQDGDGTKKDFKRAYTLARNMADQGEVVGAVLCASALLQQKNAKDNEDEVLYWMDVAIRDGDATIRTKVNEFRPKVVAAFQRAKAPPEYVPRVRKACPMKTVCYVDRFSGYRSCTTNKDYWNDCDF